MRGDRRKMVYAASLALFFCVCGFLLFLKPQLGSQASGGPHTPDSQSVAAAQSAFPPWTAQQMASDLASRAQAAGLSTLKVTPNDVQPSGGGLRATLHLDGPADGVLAFLDLVGESIQVEGGQLRCRAASSVGGACPLYTLSNLNLASGTQAEKTLLGAVDISLAAAPAGGASTTTTP